MIINFTFQVYSFTLSLCASINCISVFYVQGDSPKILIPFINNAIIKILSFEIFEYT